MMIPIRIYVHYITHKPTEDIDGAGVGVWLIKRQALTAATIP